MPVAPKQNANKDQPVNPRRSTRSSNKEVGVAKGTVKGAAAVNTAVKSKFYDHGTTRHLTCYLPETQKRKKADEPAEQPNCHRAIFHAHFSPVFSTLSPTHSFAAFSFLVLSLFSTLLSRYRLVVRITTLTNFYDLMTIPFILFLFFIHTLSFEEMRT